MKQTGRGGRNKIDHVLKLNMAKEIAMIQRTDKGKEVRQYFIQLEDLGHLSTKFEGHSSTRVRDRVRVRIRVKSRYKDRSRREK